MKAKCKNYFVKSNNLTVELFLTFTFQFCFQSVDIHILFFKHVLKNRFEEIGNTLILCVDIRKPKMIRIPLRAFSILMFCFSDSFPKATFPNC